MQIRCNRFGAVVCALVGALWLAPALATASAHPPGNKVAHKASVHSANTKKVPQQRPRASAAAKLQRTPAHAKPAAAHKAGQSRAALAQRRAVRVQRKPTVAHRTAPLRAAARPVSGKKPPHVATRRVQPSSRPVAKTRGAATAQHAAHKPPVRRPSGHKKTAH